MKEKGILRHGSILDRPIKPRPVVAPKGQGGKELKDFLYGQLMIPKAAFKAFVVYVRRSAAAAKKFNETLEALSRTEEGS